MFYSLNNKTAKRIFGALGTNVSTRKVVAKGSVTIDEKACQKPKTLGVIHTHKPFGLTLLGDGRWSVLCSIKNEKNKRKSIR